MHLKNGNNAQVVARAMSDIAFPEGKWVLKCVDSIPGLDPSESLKDKTLFITGGSRGIGLEIAKRAAAEGANVVIAAKTAEPHPVLPGTIHTAAAEIEEAGGNALALQVDIRDEASVEGAMNAAVERFGGIDILVNNASAISLTPTLATKMKTYDLMHTVNSRGTFMTCQKALPHLLRSSNPHVLTLAPPLDTIKQPARWFAPHAAYTMAKYGMSLTTMALAEEFRSSGVAFNALWPRTAVATAAVAMIGGDEAVRRCRAPQVMSDAAALILKSPSRGLTGQFFIDDEVLVLAAGMTLEEIHEKYAVVSGMPMHQLGADLFV